MNIKSTIIRHVAVGIYITSLMSIPNLVMAQSSPFPSGYINYSDTIRYNYGYLNYLIITADSLRPAFKDFAIHKALKGYNVRIAAVEDIYQTYSNVTDSTERIKWYIADLYKLKNKNLQYVLLGGDVNIVPTRYVAPRTLNTPTHNSNPELFYYLQDSLKLIASDLYYASFYGSFNWDYGNNGRFAEIREHIYIGAEYINISDDSTYLRPYINVSRLPVHNSTEIKNYTSKLIRYERGELMYPAAYNRALFAGCKAFCDIDGMSDTKYWSDSIITNFMTGMSVSTLYDSNFKKITLRSRLTNSPGYHLINIDTHGTETGWRMSDSITYYDVNTANIQQGYAASIITTPACDVADFSAAQSLGESIILNAKNNTIAFWGATNKGFGPDVSTVEGQKQPGISRELIGHFYRHLQTEPNKHIGNIIYKSKRDFDNRYGLEDYSLERFLMLTQTLLGDAEFSIYNSTPNSIDPFNIFICQGTVYLSDFDSTAHYNITMESNDINYSTQNQDYTDIYPFSELNCNDFDYAGLFNLGITKPGYTPWRSDKDYYATVSIQDTELNKEHIRAQNIVLGNAVVPTEPSGPISVIEGGNVVFEVKGCLTITDNFTCPIGASMTIMPLNSTNN
ncbi:MAG: hypothetical protein IJ528_04020 [Bacteroidaceae bacterium]|nr:hypothetical protein [Bacteroidaceae bacterium]